MCHSNYTLVSFIKKKKRFMWDDLCENDYRKLKQKVAKANTLLLTNFLKPFITFSDALGKAIGFYLAIELNK